MNEIARLITGVQHVGISVSDMDIAVKFYEALGFEAILRTADEKTGRPVVFMQLKGLMVELYHGRQSSGRSGAIDHIAVNVTDIEAAFDKVRKLGYPVVEGGICSLPFWTSGVRFFTICGPQAEQVEFSQVM